MAVEHKLRVTISRHAAEVETVLYVAVGVLMIIAAVVGLFQAGYALWRGFADGTVGSSGIVALDQLLLVLMMVEILHTVRISVRTQTLTVQPFLVVGLIASIRRVLVITTQAARLAEQGHTGSADQAAFRNSMIELGVVAVLILIFVLAIARFGAEPPLDDMEPE
jgi:uncharacterized membrane protein (DUF373 family)